MKSSRHELQPEFQFYILFPAHVFLNKYPGTLGKVVSCQLPIHRQESNRRMSSVLSLRDVSIIYNHHTLTVLPLSHNWISEQRGHTFTALPQDP